jgi:hypothetical protein
MRLSHVLSRALFGAAVLGFVLACAPLASAAIYSPRQALPADTINQFLANPGALLAQFPNGGPQMITKVRDLAASDPATVDPLLKLLKSANPAQSAAIGTALGQIALMALSTDHPFAIDLQTKIAQSGNTQALDAFDAVVGGDLKLTAATGSTGIGGGGESQTTGTSGLGGFFAGSSFSLNGGSHNTPDTFPIFSSTPGSPGSVSAH